MRFSKNRQVKRTHLAQAHRDIKKAEQHEILGAYFCSGGERGRGVRCGAYFVFWMFVHTVRCGAVWWVSLCHGMGTPRRTAPKHTARKNRTQNALVQRIRITWHHFPGSEVWSV